MGYQQGQLYPPRIEGYWGVPILGRLQYCRKFFYRRWNDIQGVIVSVLMICSLLSTHPYTVYIYKRSTNSIITPDSSQPPSSTPLKICTAWCSRTQSSCSQCQVKDWPPTKGDPQSWCGTAWKVLIIRQPDNASLVVLVSTIIGNHNSFLEIGLADWSIWC
jgi:hypothetical protein